MPMSQVRTLACATLLFAAATCSAAAQGSFNAADNVLIADQFNNRVIEVDLSGNFVWHCGLGPADFSPASMVGTNDAQLNSPKCAELLEKGTRPRLRRKQHRAVEVTPQVPLGGTIVWQYGGGDPNVNEPVSGVAFASRLKKGHTLITDSNHSGIVEIDQNKHVVWQYFTCSGADCNLPRGTAPPAYACLAPA